MIANPHYKDVLKLYKTLFYIGRDYPKGAEWFHTRLHRVFANNKGESDPDKIRNLISRGEYVVKEIETLYSLRKYRAMKARYYDEKPPPVQEKTPSQA